MRVVVCFALVLQIWIQLTSCREQRQNSIPGAYFEDGVMWSFGSIKLGPIRSSGRIVVEKNPADTDPAAPTYQLYRVFEASSAEVKSPLVYADYHPDETDPRPLLGYLYDLKFVDRSGSEKLVDIYAVLRRSGGGANFEKARQIYIGKSKDPAGQAFSEVDLSNDLVVSEVVEGSFLGRWSIHSSKVKREENLSANLLCDLRLNPGAYRNQIADPFKKYTCVAKPGVEDSCVSNPVADGCMPPSPVIRGKIIGKFEENGETIGLVKLNDQVYAYEANTSSGEILFVSTVQEGSDAENAKFCQNRFYALARTVDDYVHPVCDLKLGPSAAAKDSKVACRVIVEINSPISYLEKPCNVRAVFATDKGDEDQVVQVIHK